MSEIADAGRTPYDAPPPVVIIFDRLETGEFLAARTHAGRTVMVIVHPPRPRGGTGPHPDYPIHAWTMTGDGVPHDPHPGGESELRATSCGEAAAALGRELGLVIDGWIVR